MYSDIPFFVYKKSTHDNMCTLAGDEGLEPPTDGFGDRYATNCANLLHIIK